MQITIRHQKRKTLAFQLTPQGAIVLIPHGVDSESHVVQQFITDTFVNLPAPPVTETAQLTVEEVQQLVAEWSARLEVHVNRVQIRAMRNKWGSISTAGTLTLANELLSLPVPLVEYVVVHELLHLKFPDHRKGWQVSMGIYLPDWRLRSDQLAQCR